jgi:hypothetical protein
MYALYAAQHNFVLAPYEEFRACTEVDQNQTQPKVPDIICQNLTNFTKCTDQFQTKKMKSRKIVLFLVIKGIL